MHQCPQYCVKHLIKEFPRILGEKAQDEIAVFLEQLVFAPIAPVGFGVGCRTDRQLPVPRR